MFTRRLDEPENSTAQKFPRVRFDLITSNKTARVLVTMASRAHRLVRRLSSAASASYDALVIGGGPVGTEIARLGGLIGLNVAVVDPRGAVWKLTIINQ